MRQRVEAITKLGITAGGEKAVAIIEAGAPLVEARKLADQIVDLFALEAIGVGGQIERPAGEPRDRLGGIARPAVGVGK